MNALSLSRDYFLQVAQPLLKRDFPTLYPRLAAGLVGNGSECFGFDDLISRDHDWGIDFFIWTAESDKDAIPHLSHWKHLLFSQYPPDFIRVQSQYGADISIMSCGDFYKSLIGTPCKPRDLNEWIRAPEENFALAINGSVFYDGSGEFSEIRDSIRYYPDDIRLKKLSACCMSLAQTGQYNHQRIAARADLVTLRSVLSRFSDAAIAFVFALNREYKPYYKWAFRKLSELHILGSSTAALLLSLAQTPVDSLDVQQTLISQLCSLFVSELKLQGLSQSDDWFLTSHAEEVKSLIFNDMLRSLPTQYAI